VDPEFEVMAFGAVWRFEYKRKVSNETEPEVEAVTSRGLSSRDGPKDPRKS